MQPIPSNLWGGRVIILSRLQINMIFYWFPPQPSLIGDNSKTGNKEAAKTGNTPAGVWGKQQFVLWFRLVWIL